MLTPDEVVDVTRDLWKRHQNELLEHDRVYRYVHGKAGVPDVPEGASDELHEIARLSVLNVLENVVDAFTLPMSVEGFRSSSEEQNADVWKFWQADRMDARQSDIYRPANTYGSSYVIALKDTTKIRSPRRMIAVYADPEMDLWPVYALEHWIDYSGTKPARKGVLYFEETAYPVDLGNAGIRITRTSDGEEVGRQAVRIAYDEKDAFNTGAPQPPVVRYIGGRDSEDLIVGEVARLIHDQRSLNEINFDRLSVSRFGAFPQKVVIGWSAADANELQKTSVARLMSFDDDDVKASAFPAAQIAPYNELINDQRVHIAKRAHAPIAAVMDKVENVGADTIAALDQDYQNKLGAKRRSFGESHEQYLRLKGQMNGIEVDDEAEVIWDTTEVQSYAGVMDGITKLATVDPALLPELLQDVPGWNQQRIERAQAALRRASGAKVIDLLRRNGGADSGQPEPA